MTMSMVALTRIDVSLWLIVIVIVSDLLVVDIDRASVNMASHHYQEWNSFVGWHHCWTYDVTAKRIFSLLSLSDLALSLWSLSGGISWIGTRMVSGKGGLASLQHYLSI